ncbi:cadherin-related family member 2 [Nematolebias whitei]|uniref:cadherin-related family member 2 n=1 Tax=Nematolebias whitei TaxID=451745 RepID=UPI00189B9B52|nr:cadherin-related family member 2 [Nematolebias whitei]
MTVIDPDKDVNTKLTLEGEDKDVFSVEPSTAVSDTLVQLRVRQPEKLDFEQKQQMILQVIAEDMDKPSFRTIATVTINIKDANDNSPTFPQDTYELEVPEHSPNGTTLTHIAAEDPDTMDQGKITYKLLPESILPMFDVDPKSGTVYVKNGALLDREVRSLYSATLQASDSDNKPGSTVLEITLTDINDQPPVINRQSYQEYVKEGENFESRIEATDRDEVGSVNSEIWFSIEPNQYSNNFTIDENTGWLRNKGELDLEWLDPELKGRIELNVMATDKGTPPLSSTVPFIIILEDDNDNTPEFKEIAYNFSVKEGEKGAFVGSVHAEDRDQTSVFNRISFRIISGGLGSFSIIASAADKGYIGKISVDQDIELEYETEHTHFQLQVEASDTDSKKSVVTVEVNVLDVNDERPEFLPIDPVTVKENTFIIGPIGSFIAQDKDTNHSLIYKQESVKCRCNNNLKQCEWFIVDPTGEVRVNPKETVDYEECDQAVIEAQVEDGYTEKGEKDSVKPGLMVINIEDINDNAPQFIYSDDVFVVVAEGSNKDTSVAHVTAIDKDSGENRKIEFKVKTVQFQHSNNHTENLRLLFEAVTTQQDDVFVGNIQSNTGLNVDLIGKYLVTVTATDTGGLETSNVVEIFTVDKRYQVDLEFLLSEAEVDQKLDEIKRELMSATSAVVKVVDIKPVSGETSRKEVDKTVLVTYFIFLNGTALTRNEVETLLSVGEHFIKLKELGLNNIGAGEPEPGNRNPMVFILLGVVAGLIIVLLVLTTSLMCTRRNYRRKLKASKAMNTASMVNSNNQKGGAVVPGTNKYTMEGANPVLNLHIDTTVALDLDGESSDMDKVSLNSLDDHYDTNSNDTNYDMQRIKEEEEDDGPPEYNEPLSAALAQVGPKKTAKTSNVGFTNPIFDTTDL